MPWEVDEVSTEWLEAMRSLVEDFPKMQSLFRDQERGREAWLKKSNYRSYLKKRQG